MVISCCGNDCTRCEQYGAGCAGCYAVRGRTAWVGQMHTNCCPFYQCAVQEHGLRNCGMCKEFPCELYQISVLPDAQPQEMEQWAEQRRQQFAQVQAKRVSVRRVTSNKKEGR